MVSSAARGAGPATRQSGAAAPLNSALSVVPLSPQQGSGPTRGSGQSLTNSPTLYRLKRTEYRVTQKRVMRSSLRSPDTPQVVLPPTTPRSKMAPRLPGLWRACVPARLRGLRTRRSCGTIHQAPHRSALSPRRKLGPRSGPENFVRAASPRPPFSPVPLCLLRASASLW